MAAPTTDLIGSVQVLVDRAQDLSQRNRHAEAVVELRRALKIDPRNPGALTAMGWALEHLGPDRLGDARAAYEQALELDNEDLWALEGLANVLQRSGDREAAEARWLGAIREAEGRVEREPELLELLGWCCFRLGEHERALAWFDQALAKDPDLVAVRFDLGLTLLVAGRVPEGVEAYEAALRILTQRPAAERPGALRIAIEDLEEALRERRELHGRRRILRVVEMLTRAFEAGAE